MDALKTSLPWDAAPQDALDAAIAAGLIEPVGDNLFRATAAGIELAEHRLAAWVADGGVS